MSKKGARVVALVPVGGATGIFNTKKPITKPSDMSDLRIRALDENQIKLLKAWGSNGVIVTMPEVANALKTGIADGYINPPFVPFLFGHTDILKYYTDAQDLGAAPRLAGVERLVRQAAGQDQGRVRREREGRRRRQPRLGQEQRRKGDRRLEEGRHPDHRAHAPRDASSSRTCPSSRGRRS